MHTSYLSLAVFALGAAAAPSFPKPNGDPFAGSFPFFPSGSSSASEEDSGLSNPVPAYMAAMDAVQSAQHGAYSTPKPTPAAAAPQQEPGSFHPKHEQKPDHAPASMANPVPSDSIPAIPSEPAAPAPESSHKKNPVATSAIAEAMAQMPTNAPETVTPVMTPLATPSLHVVVEATGTHVMMSGFVSMPSPTPTQTPSHSMGVHEGHMSSSMYHATPTSSATPSASASMVPDTKAGAGLLGLGSMVNSVPIIGPLLSPLLNV